MRMANANANANDIDADTVAQTTQLSPASPLAVLATFAHEVCIGAYSEDELGDKARLALERAGLARLEDVVALSTQETQAQNQKPAVPLFAVRVAQGKWESLQAEGGYRMQRIEFARSVDGHETRGTIDAWGKVMWIREAGPTNSEQPGEQGISEPNALRPCPFCRSTPKLIDRENGPFLKGAFVACDTCKASQEIQPTAAQAVAAWNQRDGDAPAGTDLGAQKA